MSLKLQTIFRVLGEAFLKLAAMPDEVAVVSSRVEMSGQQYINALDNPVVGTDKAPPVTGTAAEVFAPAPANEVAAVVFGAAAAPADDEEEEEPTYIMTDKAEGFTREDYHATGWDDAALIADGYMVAVVVEAPAAPAPAPRVPNAPPAIAAPSTPPNGTQPAQPNGAQTGGGHTPAVMKDSAGLPWDARIHSGARTQNTDGSWKKKKGATPVEVARVTAELLAAGPAQVAANFTPLASAAPAPQPAAPAPTAPPAAAAAPAPAPAQQAHATGATDVPADFASLCRWITANGFTMAQALEQAKPFGIEAMGLLAQPANLAFIPLVHAELAKLRA